MSLRAGLCGSAHLGGYTIHSTLTPPTTTSLHPPSPHPTHHHLTQPNITSLPKPSQSLPSPSHPHSPPLTPISPPVTLSHLLSTPSNPLSSPSPPHLNLGPPGSPRAGGAPLSSHRQARAALHPSLLLPPLHFSSLLLTLLIPHLSSSSSFQHFQPALHYAYISLMPPLILHLLLLQPPPHPSLLSPICHHEILQIAVLEQMFIIVLHIGHMCREHTSHT